MTDDDLDSKIAELEAELGMDLAGDEALTPRRLQRPPTTWQGQPHRRSPILAPKARRRPASSVSSTTNVIVVSNSSAK